MNATLIAVLAAICILATMLAGFGYQMTFGKGQHLKSEDRRWWRFDFIWPPRPKNDGDLV